jgi:hypothetical protein
MQDIGLMPCNYMAFHVKRGKFRLRKRAVFQNTGFSWSGRSRDLPGGGNGAPPPGREFILKTLENQSRNKMM